MRPTGGSRAEALAQVVQASDGIAVESPTHLRGLRQTQMARSIYDAGWTIFRDAPAWACRKAGIRLVTVPAAGTSQDCPACLAKGVFSNHLRERRRSIANRLVHRYDTVCVEKLQTSNMLGPRRTQERHGKNVRAKTGLNRSLAGVAPAEQTAILLRAGERTGTRIELVRAAGTGRQCNACDHQKPKNRESQAAFRCRSCGHTDNADANAARKIPSRGVARIRARMHASRRDESPSEEADASRETGRQDQHRLAAMRSRTAPGGAAERPHPRLHHSREITGTHESWPLPRAQESWPNGQIS